MQDIDDESVPAGKGKRRNPFFIERLWKPSRKREPAQKRSEKKRENMGQQRKIVGGKKARTFKAQKEQKICLVKLRRQRNAEQAGDSQKALRDSIGKKIQNRAGGKPDAKRNFPHCLLQQAEQNHRDG